MRGQRGVHRLAAQRVVKALVLGLGQRRGHPVGGVQPAERRGAIDPAVRAVDKALPADLLEVGEFEIGPRLDVLGDHVQVLLGRVLDQLVRRPGRRRAPCHRKS